MMKGKGEGGVRVECERLRDSVKESGGEVGSDLDPWKLLWIRQNDADPVDLDPQHCS